MKEVSVPKLTVTKDYIRQTLAPPSPGQLTVHPYYVIFWFRGFTQSLRNLIPFLL